MNHVRLSLRRDRLDYRFCTPDWKRAAPESLESVLAPLDGVKLSAVRRVELAGGSPLAHPDFDALVAQLAERGLNDLELVTDGGPLRTEGVVESLRDRGFKRLFVVLGGVTARTHDGVLRDLGSFEPALEGLARAASVLPTFVVLPLSKHNADEATQLVAFLAARKIPIEGVLVSLPEARKLSPRMRVLILPPEAAASCAADVFRQCQGSRLEYGFLSQRGLSPCADRGGLERFASTYHERFNFLRHARHEEFVRVEACASCSLAQSCPGMEAEEVELFGQDTFRPVPLEVSSRWKLRKHNRLSERDFTHVSPFESASGKRRMALVRINGHCNMSCSFCFIDRTVPDFESDELKSEITALASAGTNHLVISGGEPSLHPDLVGIVAHARSQGIHSIELHTNGVKAADKAYAKALVDAGVTEATISLHSVDPEKSDEITRLPRAFWKTVQALKNFMEIGVETKIAHVITELNYRELPKTVRFFKEQFHPHRHHLSVCFAFVQPITDLVFSWVIPRFTDVKPYFTEALDFCLAEGIGFGGMVGQGGYPPCMLDGAMRFYEPNLPNVYVSANNTDFHKPDRCRECSFDPLCLGVRRDYVAQYGDDEIRPFQADIRMPPIPKPELIEAPRGLVQLGRSQG